MNPPGRLRTLMHCSSWQEGGHWCLATSGLRGRIVNSSFPTLWVHEFMGPLSRPCASLSERSSIGRSHSATGMQQGLASLWSCNPFTQGRMLCLCEEGHWYRDSCLTRLTSDPQPILALSVSAKMIWGSSKEPLCRPAWIITTFLKKSSSPYSAQIYGIFILSVTIDVLALVSFDSATVLTNLPA